MDFADVSPEPKEPRPEPTRRDEAAAANFQPPKEEIDDELHDNRVAVGEARQRPVRAAKVVANKKLETG